MLLVWIPLSTFAEAFEELPEFQPEQLENTWLQQLYHNLEEAQAKLDFRGSVDNSNHNELGNISLINHGLAFQSGLYLPDAEPAKASFQASYRTPKTQQVQVVLGSYRCSWGLGNILNRHDNRASSWGIKSPPHPSRYSLSGVSGSLGYHGYSLLAITSWQKRSARISNERVTSIPVTIHPELPKIDEQITAVGIQRHHPSYDLGLLAYRQVYNKPFVDGDYQQTMTAFSALSSVTAKNITCRTELSLLNKHPAAKLEAEYKLPTFIQKLAFNYTSAKQLAAYASRPGLLSSRGQCHEYIYQVQYQPLSCLTTAFSSAISRSDNNLQSQSWNSRSIISAGYRDKATELKLQLSLINRELLEELDSTYVSSLPVHYRVGTELQRKIGEHLDYQLIIRYHVQEKLQQQDNGIWTQNAVFWKRKPWQISGGIIAWNSMRTMLLPDPEGNNQEGYNLALGEDNRLFMRMRVEFKGVYLAAKAEQSWMDADRSLELNLGASIH